MSTSAEVWKWVIRTFLEEGVRFLIVGGWAREFYGHEHRANDLDLLVEFSPENWPKFQSALSQLGVDVPVYEELSRRTLPIRVRDLNPDVDLLTGINGVLFQDGWSDAVETNFGDGLPVRVLSEAHLIRSQQRWL